MQLRPGFLITCRGEAIRSAAQIICLTFESCPFASLSTSWPNQSVCLGDFSHAGDELRTASHSITLNYNTLASVKDTHHARVSEWRRSRMRTSVSLMRVNVKCTFNCLCMCINVFSLVTDTVYVLFCAWEIQCGRIRGRAEHNTSIYRPYSVSCRVTN